MRRTLALVALLAVAGCGGSTATKSPATSPTGPKTFTVSGSMQVNPAALYVPKWRGKSCTSDTGYTDVAAGVAVVVSNPSGVKVAIGALGPGKLSNSYTCSYPFTVRDVPDKWSVYSIEVGHRGQVDYSRTQLAQPVTLTLQSP